MAKWPYSTARWKRLRARKLAINPLCEACERRGQVTAATDVDHIVPISQGGEPFPGMDGLRSLCHEDHSFRTASSQPGASGATFKGCDAQGNPIDPDHPWAGG